MSLPVLPLALFTMLMLAVALHVLAASGHFPRETRLPRLATGAGLAVLWLSIVVTIASAAFGIAASWSIIPWYGAVIGGGIGILIAPLVLQLFPDRFVDGRRGLISFAGGAALLAALLVLVRP